MLLRLRAGQQGPKVCTRRELDAREMVSAEYGNKRGTCKRGQRALYAEECGFCRKEQMEVKGALAPVRSAGRVARGMMGSHAGDGST